MFSWMMTLFFKQKQREGHPWRIFDSFVRTIEPAVAAVDTDRNPCVRKNL